MLPLIPGIIPFGLIMGTMAVDSGLSYFQTFGLNTIVFAGASQLMAIDLLSRDAESVIIIFTGLMINLRFLLYSAASSSYLKELNFPLKLLSSYLLTDQSYAVTSANDSLLPNNKARVSFFFGAAIIMALSWNLCVATGAVLGNFIPAQFSLDFAVPLSFMALTVPTIISKRHLYIVLLSICLSILFYKLPFNLGLIITAMTCIFFARFLEKRAS